MFSRRFSRISARFLELKFVFLINKFGGILASGRENVQGNPKKERKSQSQCIAPSKNWEFIFEHGTTWTSFVFFVFFFTERRQEKGRLQLQIKKANQLFGADEGALFRETCQRVLGHRSGCCCYIRWNRNRPGKSTSLSSHVRIFYPCMRDRERRMCRITNPKPKTTSHCKRLRQSG